MSFRTIFHPSLVCQSSAKKIDIFPIGFHRQGLSVIKGTLFEETQNLYLTEPVL